jgi:site-specific recombinase XerD
MKKLTIKGRKMKPGVSLDKKRGYVSIRLSENGKRYRFHVGHISDPNILNQIDGKYNQLVEQRRVGKLGIEEAELPLLMKDAIALYLKLHGLARKSKKGGKQFVRFCRIWTEKWGERYVHTISATDVQNYRDFRLKDGVVDSTINREHTALRTFFKKLIEWRKAEQIPRNTRLPEGNPACEIKKVSEDRFIRQRLFKTDEWANLWANADIRSRHILLVALNLPLRLEDLKGLRKSLIDHKRNEFRGLQAKTGREYHLPINEIIWQIIKSAPGDQVLDFTGFDQRWKRIKRRAGTDIQFRDIRREAATSLLEAGHDIREIKEMLGHASISTTYRYLGLRPDNLQGAGRTLSAKYAPPTLVSQPEMASQMAPQILVESAKRIDLAG